VSWGGSAWRRRGDCVDLHAHDLNSITLRLHAQDGVTTALELEGGAFPVNKWYLHRESKASINFGASVSHAALRAIAFGAVEYEQLSSEHLEDEKLIKKTDWAHTESTPEQRSKIEALFKQGLSDGGLGFGFHLAATPGASPAEMLSYYDLSAKEGVNNFVHIRSLGQVTPLEAGREVVHAAEKTGASIHVVHINSSGLWETKELLDVLYDAQQKGLNITTEVYPYTGAESSLDDPRVVKGLDLFRAKYSDLELVATGERLTEESFQHHKKNTTRRRLVAHIMDKDNVDAAIAHPMVMIASDGGDIVEGRGHPRGTGTYARILGQYVREREVLTLMDALRKISLMPAQLLEKSVPQMKVRGRLQDGMVADITIFDPQTIADEASYASPARPSGGIVHVIVNGEPVVRGYQFIDEVYPGKAIKR
jgi:Amidohydrolase family